MTIPKYVTVPKELLEQLLDNTIECHNNNQENTSQRGREILAKYQDDINQVTELLKATEALGYKTSPEWIKTTDRLPDEGKTVLIAILHKYSNEPWKYIGKEALYKNGNWLGKENHSYITPEYWRPWPILPFVEDFGGEQVL